MAILFREAQPGTNRNRLAIVVLWLIFYASFTLVTPPLLDDADSVHAEVAREMLLRKDWVTLYANGVRYLEKAPLLYWSMAASMRTFGVSAAAARLPLALAVLALSLLLEAFARRAFDATRAGLYAGLITLSSFGIFIFTRINIPDAAVCLWVTAALFCYWRNTQRAAPSRTLCYGFALACALNVLTKGLIGIVFPVVILLLHLLALDGVRGTLSSLRRLYPGTSLAVFLAVAAPWHIAAALANPAQGHPAPITYANGHWNVPLPTDGNVHGWAWFYFVNEQLLRYLNLRVPRDYDTVPLVLFYALLLVWLMPWSAFLPNALADVPWRRAFAARWSASRTPRSAPVADTVNPLAPQEQTRLLLGIWAAAVMIFFSFSTRQEYYVLPAMPALILLLAGWLNSEAEEAETFSIPCPHLRAGRRIALVLFVLGSMAAAVAAIFILGSRATGANVDLAMLLRQNPSDYALSFGHFLDLNARAMGAFRLPLVLTALALFPSTLLCWRLRGDFRPHAGTLCLAAGAFLFLIAAHGGLRTFAPVLSSERLAAALEPQLKQRGSRSPEIIVINGEYEAASTLGFYLGRNDLHILNGRSSNLWYGSFFADAPHIFEDDVSMQLRWTEDQRVFLWTETAHAPKLPGRVYVIAESGGKEILSNEPNPF